MRASFYRLVDSPSELPEGIGSVEGGCSAGVGSAGWVSSIGSGMGGCSTAGVGGGAASAGLGLGGIRFFGLAFFFAERFALFFIPFLAFRFLAKQWHRPIVEVRMVISLLGNFCALVHFRAKRFGLLIESVCRLVKSFTRCSIFFESLELLSPA